jgi:hypothetical protein
LDILYGGQGIGKLQFLIKNKFNFFFSCNFFSIFVIKALDPDWIRIRIGLQPQPLDPDPDPEKMNTDPKNLKKKKSQLLPGSHTGRSPAPTLPGGNGPPSATRRLRGGGAVVDSKNIYVM